MENNKNQKKRNRLLFWIIVIIAGAVFSLLPISLADDKCLFGYYAVCPFAPFSSLIMLVIAFYLLMIRKKQYISN
jgi:hypothetical protein